MVNLSNLIYYIPAYASIRPLKTFIQYAFTQDIRIRYILRHVCIPISRTQTLYFYSSQPRHKQMSITYASRYVYNNTIETSRIPLSYMCILPPIYLGAPIDLQYNTLHWPCNLFLRRDEASTVARCGATRRFRAQFKSSFREINGAINAIPPNLIQLYLLDTLIKPTKLILYL